MSEPAGTAAQLVSVADEWAAATAANDLATTDVHAWRDGRWRCVHSHITPVAT
ncbi:hypothetical protein SAMN05421805_101219 [Saccharopolyspora antimicrobica]|uniref:Uncharacterized protein n=1 Tax=Saccharopolyspora antimicrobica TaxID=455193 RepID=A0A1I4QQD3_9PSEU|nr:hypothetical protein [Saccharopolyspora antimicrobica]SFM42229.1 hypothetical protein SAMN05421805_101219 [Saccharopolyspora antimicrobica]